MVKASVIFWGDQVAGQLELFQSYLVVASPLALKGRGIEGTGIEGTKGTTTVERSDKDSAFAMVIAPSAPSISMPHVLLF
jgi:hypothetical protein